MKASNNSLSLSVSLSLFLSLSHTHTSIESLSHEDSRTSISTAGVYTLKNTCWCILYFTFLPSVPLFFIFFFPCESIGIGTCVVVICMNGACSVTDTEDREKAEASIGSWNE